MDNSIVKKLIEIMENRDLDAVVCLSPENFAYVAGFVVPSQLLMRWRQAAVIVTRNEEVTISCVDMEEATVRQKRPEWSVHSWDEFSDNPMAVLGNILMTLGTARRVGIEIDYITVNQYDNLQNTLENTEFVAVDVDLDHARMTKSPHEIELLAKLSRISEYAINEALYSVRSGSTEMDIASTLVESVYAQGAQDFKLMIVATGERSQFPNVGPTRRALQHGDICRVEIFSVIDGYQAGVCRTAVVGAPDDRAQEIYRNLAECKDLVIDTIKPGISGKDVYSAYRRHFDKLGLQSIDFVGHSIGVNLHEAPYLGPMTDQILEPGMVFGIEPLVYQTGRGYGLQIKDMISVTEDGCQLLSNLTDTNNMFVIEP